MKRISALAEVEEKKIVAICPSVLGVTAADATKEFRIMFRIYLNGSGQGGISEFPHLGISLRPKAGAGLRWNCINEKGIKVARAAHQETSDESLDEKKFMLTIYIK